MSRGRFEQKREKPRRGKIILIILAVLLVVIAAAVIAGVIYYNSMLDKINHVEVPKIQYTTAPTETVAPTEESTEAETEPTETVHIPSSADYINFLVVGQAARFGDEEHMADTMMIFTVNTYEKTVTQTSILRDTLIGGSGPYKDHNNKEHRWGNIKINTVYHLGHLWDGTAGSMAVINQTLYDNFGVEIDHNIEISFDAFTEIINALGGIHIELTEAEAKYLNDDDLWVRYEVKPGKQHLDGMAALCYARMRKAEGDSDSDIVRTARQRKFVEAIMNKVQRMNLKRLQKIANNVLPMITTSMTNEEITDMLLTFLPMIKDLEIVNGGECPANGWGDMVDIYGDGMYHSVMRFDPYQTKKEMRAITEGEAVD